MIDKIIVVMYVCWIFFESRIHKSIIVVYVWTMWTKTHYLGSLLVYVFESIVDKIIIVVYMSVDENTEYDLIWIMHIDI